MKIGVLSDTHNNLSNLITALQTFRDRKIHTVIHCGDLTDFDLISHFDGFHLIYLTGNMDHANGTIQRRVTMLNDENFAGPVYRGTLDGVSVAATHSHIEGKVMELVHSGSYEWVFHGHTHQRRDDVIRNVRVVNPGALGGLNRGSRTFCIVDLGHPEVEFIRVQDV
ncbi:YfcE family phosphodiesterase [bacterium]|nr:YfcE family phosphodiesterase [bacterium]